MMKNTALSRPAASAIAAFLALSTSTAFAQEAPTVTMTPPVAAPTPQTPPTVPEPSMTAPVATPQATQPAAPKPLIRLPDITPADTATPKAAEPADAPAPARAQRTIARSQPAAAAATPKSDSAPAAVAATVSAEETAAAPVPVMAPAEPVAKATPLPAERKAVADGDFPWEIVGGAAALLIAGGAGLVFARRRRSEGEFAEESWEPAAATEPMVTPRATIAEPSDAEAQPWVTPAYTPHERTPPAFAAASGGSIGRHEAMAMVGPTENNPFTTLSKRLKRARFLDRQERAAYNEALGAQKDMARKPISAWEISQRPAPVAQEQEVQRPEPGRGRPGLRPGFVRN